jgi:hypothetical protein
MAANLEPNQDYGRMMNPRPRVRRLPMPMQGARRIPLPMVGREMTMGELPPIRMPRPMPMVGREMTIGELPPIRMPRPALGMGGGAAGRLAPRAMTQPSLGAPVRSADDAAALSEQAMRNYQTQEIENMLNSGQMRPRRGISGMMGQVAGPMRLPQSVDMDSLRAALSRIAGGF